MTDTTAAPTDPDTTPPDIPDDTPCPSTHTLDNHRTRCVLAAGHDGFHDDMEHAAWPDTASDTDTTYITPPESSEAAQALIAAWTATHQPPTPEPGPQPTFAWDNTTDNPATPPPAWHADLDQRITERNTELARMARDRATTLAIRALAPIAGIYRDPADYISETIALAEQLGTYIKNGPA